MEATVPSIRVAPRVPKVETIEPYFIGLVAEGGYDVNLYYICECDRDVDLVGPTNEPMKWIYPDYTRVRLRELIEWRRVDIVRDMLLVMTDTDRTVWVFAIVRGF